MIIPDFREFKNRGELYHYGVKRRSGRYPWGSGERPYQGIFSDLKNVFKMTIDKAFGKYGTDNYVLRDGKYEKKMS